jgi:hypothetical protein
LKGERRMSCGYPETESYGIFTGVGGNFNQSVTDSEAISSLF